MKHILISLLFFMPLALCAQEDAEVVHYSRKYLDLKIGALAKYTARVERQQERTLKRLRRKEAAFLKQLRKKDSAAHARLSLQPVDYDSISTLSKNKNLVKRASPDKVIDSLKGAQRFLETKSGASFNGADQPGYDQSLGGLQTKLNHQQKLNELIEQRPRSLKRAALDAGSSVPALKAIEMTVFYGKEKISVFKDISQQPSKAEEKALEFLQGTEGFDQALSYDNNPNSMRNATSAADLEKMGFQTRRQLNEHLTGRFGDQVGNIQKQVGEQIGEYQDQLKQVTREAKAAKQQVKTAGAEAKESAASIKKIRNINEPGFKVNPMRGLPFWQRVEKSYSWQVSKAAPDGGRPAIVEFGAMAGFRHTPRITYGLGVALPVGLGTDWSNIRFTVEGMALRSFASWEWKYGIGAYGGYERLYRMRALSLKLNDVNWFETNGQKSWADSFLIGINKNRKGKTRSTNFQLLYDVFWKQNNLNSPVLLRIAFFKE